MRTDEKYWSERYQHNQTGWDLDKVSPPLKSYIDQLEDKSIRILIPGAGNAYEAEYLFEKGFKNVYVLDLAKEPLANLKRRVPGFPTQNLLKDDFFHLEGEYDLVLEQTFFCALPVEKREAYAQKMTELLNNRGKLAGVLFDTHFEKDGPPFGGSKKDYETLFAPFFEVQVFETCYNSVTPRMGNELFFIFIKK